MSLEQRERELKFDVPEDFQLPDIGSTATGATEANVETTTKRLDATYYDTDDRHLQRAGITLRRRRGGDDDGWHLKLPVDGARIELQVESRATTPPRELADLVLGTRLGQPLRPRLKLQTSREAHRIVDGDETIAEVAVDDVTSTTTGLESAADRWRELEIELGPAGDERLLRSLAKQLRKGGAVPAGHASKYVRGIGDAPRRARLKGLAALVDDYLEQQRDAIATGDLRMRRDENAIHRTRVAVRRTRSTLRVFGDLFDPQRTAALDSELRWYAAVLGRVRDLDIIREALVDDAVEVSDELALGDLRNDVVFWLDQERDSAWRGVQTTLRGRRYKTLLGELDRWRVDPPWTDHANQRKPDVRSYVGSAERKATKRLRRAFKTGTSNDYHRARKAAKRWRYALELATPQLGGKAKKQVKSLKRMQDDLGAIQDAVMTADVVRRMGASTPSQTRNRFGYGVLYARAEQSVRAARSRAKKRYR